MTNQPIYRIPLDGMTLSLTDLMDVEGPHDNNPLTAMQNEVDAQRVDSKPEDTSIMLDWAAQLRNETGRSWGECIRTAQIMYYG